jgi:phosphatidylethanolamine/phosphatidyl-N-methylethanolamine N-methyltransferase
MSLETGAAFLREFVRRPTQIGAVAPSSDALARAMVDGMDWERARVVVECGPGTGAITPRILERLGPGTRFFAVEVNETCARELKRRHPGLTVHRACVSDLTGICRSAGVSGVDVVISGLPWAAFGDEGQARFLGAIYEALRPGGQFATFAYSHAAGLPAGRRFRGLLARTFSEVERSRSVWRNLPPAFVYRCRK